MPDDIIKTALEQFKESEDGTSFSRTDFEDDVDFARIGNQWPEKVRKQRQEEGRPCLTINKLPAFIRQVTNDARQNKRGVKVHPVDNGADIETAGVIDGLIRSIERNGEGADVAYDTAIDHAASGGFGFFRIAIDYAHDETFDLECSIRRVPNALMVHWDTSSTAFDASDWNYAFISDFLSEDEFKRTYKGAQPVSFQGDDKDMAAYWLDDDKVRIAEYFTREEVERKLILLSNGVSIREKLLDEERKGILAVQGVVPVRERTVKAQKVVRHIISGVEELDSEDWPGSTIPICPVWGEEVIHLGRRHFRSLIRDAKDPQTMFNFWRSASTELVALAPRAPWLLETGSIPRGQEPKWESANTRSHAYLEYVKGKNIPQRQAFAGVPAGAIQEAMNASDDIKAITGIYDSSLGQRSNETSGRAILARQKESDVSNFHFPDNLSRAIRYCGKCLVEIIPAVYSPRETIRILGEDRKEDVVKLVSQSVRDDPMIPAPYENQDGERLYDLTVGKYDVDVETGPSYATQREETREILIEIMRTVPGAGQMIGDIVAKHLDFQGADEVAERLKSLLPPQVQQPGAIPNATPTAGPMQPMQSPVPFPTQ